MLKFISSAILAIFVLISPHCCLWADSRNLPEDEYFDFEVSTETIVPPAETYPIDLPIKIVHPWEGQCLPYLKSSFVFGSVDPRGKLTINHKSVPIHPGGGFLAMVDYSTGTFQIQAELRLPTTSYTKIRKVYVNPPPVPLSISSTIIKSAQPEEDISLPTNDSFFVQCLGSPGAKVFFTIHDVTGKFPMAETQPGKSGIYQGSYLIKSGDDFQKSRLQIVLTNVKEDEKTSMIARGQVSVLNENIPWIVEVSTDTAKICAGYSPNSHDSAGYILFPLPGTRLRVIGRKGSELKIYLNETRTGWISEKNVTPLPKGTPLPLTVIGSVNVKSQDAETIIRIQLNKKIPFEVSPSLDGHTIDLSFFGAISNTDWISYSPSQPNTPQVQWFQDDSQTYRLRIWNKENIFWGCDARYEGKDFILALKSPPPLQSNSALAGITIAIDAGHSGDSGTVGPTGLMEKEANWKISQCLQKKLLSEGAKVVMIRQNGESVSLPDRPRRARQSGADLLISVHNNSLPEGQNPLEKNGYGVYYYHPQSFNLAREISSAYQQLLGKDSKSSTPLRDDGIYYGNLALARIPQMPAVIVESAYIILPAEEAFLRTEQFQQACANAMLLGIKRYLTTVREKSGEEKYKVQDIRSK
ncbi:MAG: N-acetylmuramoyl-L-alanine amidase [Elusimicrobiota bacterium]